MENKVWITSLSLLLLGCRSGAAPQESCASTLATMSDDARTDSVGLVPAGGFVAFGDRGCTATFVLQSADAQSIKLTAFTASHCSRDDSSGTEKISIALHVPGQSGSAGGYLKNLVVRDEFYERRKEFLGAVQELNNPRAAYIAEAISKIPTFGSWWGFQAPGSGPLTQEQSDTNRNLCLLKSKTDDMFKSSEYRHCWSVFDTGARVLELRRADVGDKNFQVVSQYLQKKNRELKNFLISNQNVSQQYSYWTTQIQGRMGGFRLLNYVKLAAFLNQDICGKYLPANAADRSACTVRQNLIDLGSKYLVELDLDGKRKNVFEKAKELGLAINAPIPIDTYDQPFDIGEHQSDMEYRADKIFLDRYNATISEVGQILAVKNNVLAAPARNILIATNISLPGSGSQRFGLVNFAGMSGPSQNINAQGLSEYVGIMKLYLNQSQQKLTFSKGDSGSMITIAGVVPLLALNTVNDEPTSGGASILALPVPKDEDVPASLNASLCK